jgi:tetratricopeptide (TPR) repeat protein
MTSEHLGAIYYQLGDYRRAIAALRQSVAWLAGGSAGVHTCIAGPNAVEAQTRLVLCLAEVGAFAEGRPLGEAAVQLAETLNHPISLARAYCGVGMLCLYQGDRPQATLVLERGLACCRAWDIRDWGTVLASAVGAVYALSGRVIEAIPLLEEATEHTALQHRGSPAVSRVLWLSEGYLLAGRLGDALQRARQALELARAAKERGHEAWTLRLLGEIAAHGDPLEGAPAAPYYRQALALAEDLGMRPLQAHCHRGLGTLYAATGQQEQARTELSTAMEMYQSMDMTFWLPQTEAALTQVDAR